MNAALAFRRAALLQVLLALGAFSVADRNEWFLVAGGVLTVASSYITEGPRGRHLPNWIVGPGVILAGAWGAVNFLQHPEPRAVASIVGAVVLAILMLKLYGRKGPSDWRQVLALTVVIVVAAALNSMDLLAGIFVMAYAGVALISAMLYQIYSGARRAEVERSAVTGVPITDRWDVLTRSSQVVSGAGSARHLRGVLLLSCVVGLLMSTVVFVLFPRDSTPGNRAGGGGRQSGFTNEIRLRGGDAISVSSREVFRVQMLDPQGQAAQFSGALHLRGAVLDTYNLAEDAWTTGAARNKQYTSTVTTPSGGEFVLLAREALEERANVWTQVVEMRSMASDYVFGMWLPIAISTPQERTFTLNSQNAVIRDRADDRSGRPWQYALRIQPFPGPRIVRAMVPSGGGSGAEVSFPVPEVVVIARKILERAQLEGLPTEDEAKADPALRYERNRRIARLFTDYLQGPEFKYTVDLSGFVLLRREDPNISFLQRYKFGHCEFFASALGALCRSVGVDARVVTGFAVSEYDSGSDQYVVRESNAHAWVEVRTGEWQWSTFDPSPSADLLVAQNTNRSWLDQFRWVLDPLEFAWQSRVVSFDSGSQAELAESVRLSLGGAIRSFVDWTADVANDVNRAFRLGPAGYIWLGLVALLLAVAVVAIWVLAKRDRKVRELLGAARARASLRARLGRDAGFYLDALDVLRRSGLEKPRWCTPMAFAEQLHAQGYSEVGDAFAALVRRFYSVRYANMRSGRARRAADAALVTALRGALARGYTRGASAS